MGVEMNLQSDGLLRIPSCCGYLGRSLTCVPRCSRPPGKSLDYEDLRGADKLMARPGRRQTRIVGGDRTRGSCVGGDGS